MVILNVPDKSGYCFINVDESLLPKSLVSTMDDILSFYVQNHERTDSFLTGRWDGKFHMLKRARNGTFYFPIGLIPDVCNMIESWGFYVAVNYPRYAQCSIKYDWNSTFELREYQRQIIVDLIQKNGTGTVEIPTGAGKTLIALKYAHFRKCPFMVVVHRKELMNQWIDEIQDVLGVEATPVGDGARNVSGDVVVAMVQTLHSLVYQRKERFFYPLVIFDEVHTVPARTAYYVAARLGSRWRLGLSATARRTDGMDELIRGVTGEKVGTITVEELVSQGYLARPRFQLIRVSTPPGIGNKDTYASVYKRGITLNDERNEYIAKHAIQGMKDGRMIYIHVRYITHGTLLSKLIPDSVFVHGTSPNRTEEIEAFKQGTGTRCLISTLLKEGVNAPSADMYINAAAGQSFVSTIQTAGRTLRVAPGKSDTIIIDFIDDGHRFMINDTQHRFSAYSEVYGKFFDEATVL